MLNTKPRGFVTSAGAFVAAIALVLGGVAAAHAAPVNGMPESSGLVITKLKQPDDDGAPATGLPLAGELPSEVIPGVTFEAYPVPLTEDPLTNKGQAEIAGTTLSEATALTDGVPAARTGTTDGGGQIHWQTDSPVESKDGDDLEAGLWLIREVGTPPGVVAAGDILVAVPLTHPTDRNAWLDTIYVYPKNHTVGGVKSVSNAAELVVGDEITWTITVDNPSPRDPITGTHTATDRLQVVDEFDSTLLHTAEDGSGVNVSSPAGLVKDEDYTVLRTDGPNGTHLQVDFESSGLDTLAAEPTADVTITIETVVVQLGTIQNNAAFFSSQSQSESTLIRPAEVRYGGYALHKKSAGAPAEDPVDLSGAEFMVFASAEAARDAVAGTQAARDAALKPVVTVPGYDPQSGVWETDSAGRVDIAGLRHSDFADGELLGDDDPRFQPYWLVETRALDGHQLLAEPVRFLVNDSSMTQDTESIVNQFNRGGFWLPLTGGIGTILFTVVGLVLVAVVLLIARRRRAAGDGASAVSVSAE